VTVVVSKKYEVIQQVGKGGMGVVYRVRHTDLDTMLALKVLPRELSQDLDLVERFRREARVMARLNHPNIVRVFDFEKEGETYYLTMEFLAGKSLRQLLDERQGTPLPLPEVLRVGVEVAKALAYAHEQSPSVIHRDIKPSNVIVEEGTARVVVTDFGIAKLMGESQSERELTQTGLFVGTVKYCAPEQLRHDADVDARVDLYALGMMLFELCNGKHYFAGLKDHEIIGRLLYETGENTVDLPGAPTEFQQLLARAIARDRTVRPATARAMLAELEAASVGLDEDRAVSVRLDEDRTVSVQLDDRTVSARSWSESDAPKLVPDDVESQISHLEALRFRREVEDRKRTCAAAREACLNAETSEVAFQEIAAAVRVERQGEALLAAGDLEAAGAAFDEARRAFETAGEVAASRRNIQEEKAREEEERRRAAARKAQEPPAAESPSQPSLATPTAVKRYKIVDRIGAGRVGTVYRAYDPARGGLVALKLLSDAAVLGEEVHARFFRAGGVWLDLRHPNVVRIYDLDPGGAGVPGFIAMEMLSGEELSKVLARGERLPLKAALEMACAVCDGVHYMHESGVIHRDLRAENVFLLSHGGVKVLDSGIARSVITDDMLTSTGVAVGVSASTAPEQARGRADTRSDVFAIGALLYQVLTLDTPLPDPDANAQRLRAVVPAPPSELVEAISCALEHDPDQRFQSVRHLRHAIDGVRRLIGDVEPASDQSSTLPERIQHYRIIEEIGRGRTGVVYRAYSETWGDVALKVIARPGEVAGDVRARFFRAGRAWLRLESHPNVIRLYDLDVGLAASPGFIAMELLAGEELRHVLARGRDLSATERLRLMADMAAGLQHLHDAGLIHRDVRPGNFFVLPDGSAKILDSGLARLALPDDEGVTRVGTPVGHPDHMAPEQMHGHADQRADVYALGAVFYELLTLERPSRTNAAANDHRLRELRPAVPQQLIEIVMSMLAHDPDERLANVGIAREQIETLLARHQRHARTRARRPVVFTLHGIRTYAAWHRAVAEVAQERDWTCRQERWYFGYFPLFRFLLPGQRRTKVAWFRKTYFDECNDRMVDVDAEHLPSIVAHSFGTYILGNALLAYSHLRFDKIVLCGSILPVDFPWDTLIARGQVQAVRNEFSRRDVWCRMVRWVVRGAGPSGVHGFRIDHGRIEQRAFPFFSHSMYFEKGHMESNWFPFLERVRPPLESVATDAQMRLRTNTPWGLYGAYVGALAIVGWVLGLV
jgi:serine/threonine-protein kinase